MSVALADPFVRFNTTAIKIRIAPGNVVSSNWKVIGEGPRKSIAQTAVWES